MEEAREAEAEREREREREREEGGEYTLVRLPQTFPPYIKSTGDNRGNRTQNTGHRTRSSRAAEYEGSMTVERH